MPAFWNNRKQLAIALIAWSVIDIVLHVAVDEVEPLRITGNIVAVVAGAVIGWTGISDALKATVAVVAVLAVLGLNVAWAIDEGEWWPPIATILITGAFVLLSRLAALSTKAATASTAT